MNALDPIFAASHRPSGCALVLGADGFLAGFIIAALRSAGWRVLRGVRRVPREADERQIDFNQLNADVCAAAVRDVDAVINVAGILRETRQQRFQTLHHSAPLAIARACVEAGVGCFVQISALGTPADGEFIASKQRFDADLLALPLRAVVLRPSVVYSTAGSYGGTSLLRAQAALPGVLPLPGDGRWLIQPLAAEDLAELVVRAVTSNVRGCFEVGSPTPIRLRDYLQSWRHWLRLPAVRIIAIPTSLVSFTARLGERFGIGPLGETTWRMLQHGNVTEPTAHAKLLEHFGTAPRALDEVLNARPSQVQDRWHARLYLLAPLLRWLVIALFLISAWVGFTTPAADIETLAAGSWLADLWSVPLARTAAIADLVLAALLTRPALSRSAMIGMLALVGAYTVTFGTLLPALWLDPLGGLAKNLVVLPALAVLWVLSDRR